MTFSCLFFFYDKRKSAQSCKKSLGMIIFFHFFHFLSFPLILAKTENEKFINMDVAPSQQSLGVRGGAIAANLFT
jgi:hypothetical protein